MTDTWYYRRGQDVFGPFSFDAIVGMASSGKLAPADDVRGSKNEEWTTADSIVGLFREPEERQDLVIHAHFGGGSPEDFEFTGDLADDDFKLNITRRFPPTAMPIENPPSPAPVGVEPAHDEESKKVDRVDERPVKADVADGPAPLVTDMPVERWFCRIDGVEQGPLTKEELNAMARHGSLTRWRRAPSCR